MGKNSTVRLSKVNGIAEAKGVDVLIVRALIGLSKPVRASLRLALNSVKTDLQGKLLTLGYKGKLLKRKQTEIANAMGTVQGELSKLKRILANMNIGPDFTDNEGLQTITGILLSSVKIKGLPIDGYRSLDNIWINLNFNVKQLERAANISDVAARALVRRINDVDKYIEVLDAIDDF